MRKLNRDFLKSPLLIGLIIVLALGWSLGVLTEGVLQKESIIQLDQWVLDHTAAIQNPELTPVMILVTNMGGALFIWAVTGIWFVYLIRKGKRFDAGLVTALMAGGWFLDVMLKYIIHRVRPVPPSGAALVPVWGWSYPSGHALMSVLFYFTIAYFISKHVESKVVAWYTFGFAFCFVLLIAFSRIYLQVHYVSDVLAGLISGLIWFAVCISLTEYYRNR